MPSLSLPQSLAVLAGTWFTWKLLKLVFAKDPFANIPGPPPDSWLTGNIARLLDKDDWEFHEHCAKKYGRAFSWTGFLGERSLYVHDAKAFQHIFVKEQHIYEEPADFLQANHRTFGKGLIATLGDTHKKQRKMLNPVFSTAHMRDMTPIFHSVVHKLRAGVAKQVGQGQETIDMLQWMSRTALELIGQSGFAHSFDSLEPGAKEHPVGLAVKNVFRAINSGLIAVVRIAIHETVFDWGTPAFQRAVVDWLPWPALHDLRDMVDTMHETAVQILEETKRAVAEGKDTSGRIGGGKDIMSILVKANMAASEEDRLPDDEILGQISTFIFAGTDTTSNALARTLDILSHHPEAQEKLRQEVTHAYSEHGGDLDFDAIMGLPYLDAVCRETLRLYAPAPVLARNVLQDVVMPLLEPITGVDGRPISEIFIPKGTRIVLSLVHCNRDTAIWGPDADEWKPERWLNPLPDSVANAKVPGIYSHLMTFIGGSRSCIGFKFSQLEMKVVLSTLFQSFKFEPTGQKVMWQVNGILQPTTEDAPRNEIGERKLQLPMRVSLVN